MQSKVGNMCITGDFDNPSLQDAELNELVAG